MKNGYDTGTKNSIEDKAFFDIQLVEMKYNMRNYCVLWDFFKNWAVGILKKRGGGEQNILCGHRHNVPKDSKKHDYSLEWIHCTISLNLQSYLLSYSKLFWIHEDTNSMVPKSGAKKITENFQWLSQHVLDASSLHWHSVKQRKQLEYQQKQLEYQQKHVCLMWGVQAAPVLWWQPQSVWFLARMLMLSRSCVWECCVVGQVFIGWLVWCVPMSRSFVVGEPCIIWLVTTFVASIPSK